MTLNCVTSFKVPQQRRPAHRLSAASVLALLAAAGVAHSVPGAHAFPMPAATLPADSALLHRVQAAGAFDVEDRAGVAGTPLALNIRLPRSESEAYSFLMFRNLPANFRLSAGFGAKDYWAVSLNDAEGLMLIPPADFQGMFSMDVLLVRGKDVEPDRRTVNIAFTDASAPAATASIEPEPAPAPIEAETRIATASAAEPEPAPQPRITEPVPRLVPQASQEMTDADRAVMERGNMLAQQGDIASARLFYVQVARKGIAAGALAMGRSYDPAFLASLGVRGLQPDIEEARNWYRTADELGSPQARRFLSGLSAGVN